MNSFLLQRYSRLFSVRSLSSRCLAIGVGLVGSFSYALPALPLPALPQAEPAEPLPEARVLTIESQSHYMFTVPATGAEYAGSSQPVMIHQQLADELATDSVEADSSDGAASTTTLLENALLESAISEAIAKEK